MKQPTQKNSAKFLQARGDNQELALQVARMEEFVRRTHVAFVARVSSSQETLPVTGGVMAGPRRTIA